MPRLTGKTVAILATDGFEQSELDRPLDALRAQGATVHVVAPHGERIKGWSGSDWGHSVPVDRLLARLRWLDAPDRPRARSAGQLRDRRRQHRARCRRRTGAGLAGVSPRDRALLQSGLRRQA